MPNPQIQAGTTASCSIQGTYTRGNAGWDGGARDRGPIPMSASDIWCIDNSGYVVVAENQSAGAVNGWNAAKVSGQNQLSITAPSNAVADTFYAAYVATDGTGAAFTYWYVVFDVVASAPPASPAIGRRRRRTAII